MRYFAFKDQIRLHKFVLPECNYHIIFVLPMSKSWSKKKKDKMRNTPHQQRPDKDNLEKALLDSIFDEDCRVWDGRTTKIWGDKGEIVIIELLGDPLELFLNRKKA